MRKERKEDAINFNYLSLEFAALSAVNNFNLDIKCQLFVLLGVFMLFELDEIDKRILTVLQEDGRIQNVDLAHKVGLSPSPCLRRVRLLEEAGVIKRYVALLDASKVNAGLTVFARVWLKGQDEKMVDSFIAAIQHRPEVLECHLMAGDCDFLLRVVVADLEAYRRFQVEGLSNIKVIQNIKSEIPMQNIKQTWKLALDA